MKSVCFKRRGQPPSLGTDQLSPLYYYKSLLLEISDVSQYPFCYVVLLELERTLLESFRFLIKFKIYRNLLGISYCILIIFLEIIHEIKYYQC